MNILSRINKKLFHTRISPLIKRGLIIIILLILNINLFSQSYHFRHFTVEDGLPSSETYHVLQDSKGYIWIATDNGVSRYDGYEFKNFTQQDGLPDNTVFEIFEDYKNRIWFIPHSAKLSYFSNDSIYEYEHNDSLLKRIVRTANPIKLSFLVDHSNKVYYADKRNGTFIIDSLGNIEQKNSVEKSHLFILNKDHIVYQNSETLFAIDKNNETIFNLPKNSLSIGEYLFFSDFIAIENNKNIFIATRNTIFKINHNFEYTYNHFPYQIIWINIDNNNNLWVGTRNGVYCYMNTDIFSKPRYHLLKNNEVSSIIKDKEGGMWFTTLNNGVHYLPNTFFKTLSQNLELHNKNIHSLAFDSTYLWLGLSNKVVGIKSDTINFEIKLDWDNIIINKLYPDIKNKELRIAATLMYSFKNNTLSKNILYNSSLQYIHSSSQAKDIIIDNKGNTWIATSNGLYKYDKNNYFIKKSDIFSQKINSLCQKQEDAYILCGCNNGLWEYAMNKDTFKYLGNKNELLEKQIDCMINNTYHNNIWLGTKSNGIVIYDNDQIYNISTKDGLSNNSITSLFLKGNVMWVATRNGLNKITFQDNELKYSYTIESFNKIHGIANNEINDIYVDDSLAYIATKKGLNIIDYTIIKKNSTPPPIYIKNIKIQDKDTIIKNHYVLPYDKNSIRIEFVGLMYKNNENKRYKYKFNQVAKKTNWIETNENNVNLSFLPSGKYTFNVLAINEDNTESIEPASISFTITPPYWKTWWFITAISFLTFSMFYIIYKIRINEINKRNNLEKKLLKEVNKFRQKALSQQMNPHFIFNTLNSIQYYIYNNDIDSSIQYLSKFSKLMRLILENSQYDTIPIQDELDTMDLYLQLEALRIDENFEFEIIVNNQVNTKFYKIYPLLIQPYIENSIWHGLIQKGDKKIKIEILPDNDSILCIIEDNGIGRERAMEIKKQQHVTHKSHGTEITSKRIEIINKFYNRDFKVEFIDLKDNAGNAIGTRVLLKIPKITD